MEKQRKENNRGASWKILRGVRSTDGHFVLIQGPTGEHWLSVPALRRNLEDTLAQLEAAIGFPFVTQGVIASLKSAVQDFDQYETGLAASQTGWLDTCFVLGTGEILQAKKDTKEYVSAVNPDLRFEPAGTLEDWQAGVEPFLKDQPLLRFLVGYSLAPVLLKWAPPDILNPILELFGAPGAGKTTAFLLMSSVWGGNVESVSGGGITGDMTPLYLDVERRRYAGMCLPIDELENISNDKEREALLGRIVFGGSGSEARKSMRHNVPARPIRSTIVMTSNSSFSDFTKSQPEFRRDAMHTRTIRVHLAKSAAPNTFAILQSAPVGYGDISRAVKALASSVSRFYGSAGRHFAQAIVERAFNDPEKFRVDFMKNVDRVRHARDLRRLSLPHRHLDALALVAVTLKMAEQVGTLPPGDYSSDEIITWMAHRLAASCADQTQKPTPKSGTRRLIAKNRDQFRPLAYYFLKTPDIARAHAGIIDESKKLLYLRASWLERHLETSGLNTRMLKSAGILHLNKSEQKKRTLTATPSAVIKLGFEKRVYAVSLAAVGLDNRLRRIKRSIKSR